MYSFPNFQTIHCSVSGSNCCLTCIQFSQETGNAVWYSHLFNIFPQFVVIHTVKGFSIVNEADFFWNSLAFSVIQWMLTIWSLVPLPLWNSSCTSGSSLKPSMKDFEHYLASMWNEHNCKLFWTFFVTALLWDWSENLPFPVLWSLSFPNSLTYWV